jgi:tetratricopeptide (TPR) repeat protein
MILAHEMVHYARQHTAKLYNHLQNPDHDTGLQYADHSPVGSARDVAKKIDAAEYQADCQGLSILKGAGYCEAEVLTLMSNLMESIKDHGTPEAHKKMANRRITMKTLIGQDQGVLSGGSASDDASERFLTRIAPALMANAQAALQRGDWKQADISVSKFLDLKPDDARAHYLQGEILRRQNNGDRTEKCLDSYEASLKIDPTFPLAHRALGEIHYKAGRYQEAKPYFETFLSLAPQDEAREYIKGYLLQCQQ